MSFLQDALLLEDDSEKFVFLKESSSLFFTSVLPTDSGYYTCKMAFPYEGVTYEITRTIKLQTVGKYCPLRTLKKVFTSEVLLLKSGRGAQIWCCQEGERTRWLLMLELGAFH